MAQRAPLVAAAACLLLAALARLSLLNDAAFRWDGELLLGFLDLRDEGPSSVAYALVWPAKPVVYVVLCAVVVWIGWRRSVRHAVVVAGVIGGAGLMTLILKPLLATSRRHAFIDEAPIPEASWPSGHASAILALGLCLVLVASPRRAPAAAVAAGLLTSGVCGSVLLLGWHYPSDVIGGLAIAAGWACAGLALLPAPAPARGQWRAAAGALAFCAGAGALWAITRGRGGLEHLAAHPALAVGAPLLAGMILGATLAVAAAVSGSGPAPRAARRRRSRRATG